jgi:asparagine synthase (glutamine-hydrolysing)
MPLIDPKYRWKSFSNETWDIHYIGEEIDPAVTIEKIANDVDRECDGSLKKYLAQLKVGWAFIAESRDKTVAAVDKIRSYPVLYTSLDDQVTVSNSARQLTDLISDVSFDLVAITEFKMSGYVTGANTLLSEIKQLQAGELLVAGMSQRKPLLCRYYRYLPQPENGRSLNTWIDELTETTEGMFRRMVASANGRQLLIPLSGGLDSRLIVCMLRDLGYDNVRTFSYGPHANHEARIAKSVAGKVGFRWQFVPTTHIGYRSYFSSPSRKDYWNFSDGLSTVPNMQDIYPFLQLRERGLSRDAIVVNGQSGDFISGGHIPSQLLECEDRERLIDALLEKHFALRESLRTTENMAVVSRRIEDSLNAMEIAAGKALPAASLYESWEWQERQCKYVIGGQRIYDWLGMDWRLPLWDASYLDFWSRVPVELKRGQRLYKEYLRSRNYCGLFRDFNPKVWRWPGAALAVLPLAQIVGFLGGRGAKQRFYAYARYIGHYGPNYAPWGWSAFKSEATDIRNPVSMLVSTWLREAEQEFGMSTYNWNPNVSKPNTSTNDRRR